MKCMLCSHQKSLYDVKHHEQGSVIDMSPGSFSMVGIRDEGSWYLDSVIQVVAGNFHNS